MNSYIFIGKLYPKPINFSFPYFESSISSSKDQSYDDRMKIGIIDDKINITLDSNFSYSQEEFGVLKNSILYLVKGYLDAFGYCSHTAFNIDIQAVILPGNRALSLIGVPSETDTKNVHSIDGKTILNLYHKSQSLNRALVDYRNALIIPEDAEFFLYRVTEDIRRHFEKKFKLEKGKAWEKMNQELTLSPEYIKTKIKPFADGIRHGDLVSITQESGMELFLNTRNILDRFILYLKDGEKKLEMDTLT